MEKKLINCGDVSGLIQRSVIVNEQEINELWKCRQITYELVLIRSYDFDITITLFFSVSFDKYISYR